MSQDDYPMKIKLALPSGHEVPAKFWDRGPANNTHLAEYTIDATANGDPSVNNALRMFVNSIIPGSEQSALERVVSGRGCITLFMPFVSLGSGVSPANLPTTLPITRNQAIAIIIQTRGGEPFHSRHACSVKDICSHCINSIRQSGHLQPFPEYCAFNKEYDARRCGNRLWAGVP